MSNYLEGLYYFTTEITGRKYGNNHMQRMNLKLETVEGKLLNPQITYC
jgi:hypothetical protein